jgi:hypothetical protein
VQLEREHEIRTKAVETQERLNRGQTEGESKAATRPKNKINTEIDEDM